MSNQTPEQIPPVPKPKKLAIVLLFVGFLALDIWLLTLLVPGSWVTRIKVVVQILTVYTFVFGLLHQTILGKTFSHRLEQMTSANLYIFVLSNLDFLGMGMQTFGHVLKSLGDFLQSRHRRRNLDLLDAPLLFVYAVFAFVYPFIHLLVIVPFAYIAYALAQVPIRIAKESFTDQVFQEQGKELRLKQIIANNEVELRNFMVAFPGIGISLVLEIIA